MNRLVFFLIVAGLLGSSCEGYLAFSIYEARVPEEKRNSTLNNINLLKERESAGQNSFSFAVISDVHYHYDILERLIAEINSSNDIDFILIAGDLTDQGLMNEYLILHNILSGCTKPYFTVIGNHDYLSNGEEVYRQMFGPTNYSFTFQGATFICFDDVIWESNQEPDFEWLTIQLNSVTENRLFVLAHIAPFGDQFNPVQEGMYTSLIFDSRVDLSIHGHAHSYYHGEYYGDGREYLTVPWVGNSSYCVVDVRENGINVSHKTL